MMYQDYEVVFFNILKYLKDNTEKNKDISLNKDNIIETLINILGYQKDIKPDSFVYYIKSKSQINLKFKERLYNLLLYLKNKILKYDKTILKIKLKRANRLTTGKLINYTNLIGKDYDETKKNINQVIYNLKNDSNIDNIINNEIAANNALLTSLSLVDIPNFKFSDYITSLIMIIGNESKYNISRLNVYRDSLLKERNRLSKLDNIINNGYYINGIEISLIKIIDLLLNLLEKKYTCSECRYYVKGNNFSICKYQNTDLTPKTKQAIVVDLDRNNISGYITNDDMSCKDVWDLIDNNYFSPNDNLINDIKKKFK